MGKLRRYVVTYPIMFIIVYIVLSILFLIKPSRHKILFDMRPMEIKMIHEVIKAMNHYILAGIAVFWAIMYVLHLIIKKFIPWPFKKPLLRAPVIKECRQSGVFELIDAILEVVASMKGPKQRLLDVMYAFHHFLRRNIIDILNITGLDLPEEYALDDVDLEDEERRDLKNRKDEEKKHRKYVNKTGADARSFHLDKYLQCVEEGVNVNWNPSQNAQALVACRARAIGDIMESMME